MLTFPPVAAFPRMPIPNLSAIQKNPLRALRLERSGREAEPKSASSAFEPRAEPQGAQRMEMEDQDVSLFLSPRHKGTEDG